MAKVYIIFLCIVCACTPVRDPVPVAQPSASDVIKVDTIIKVDTLVYCPENITEAFLDTLKVYIGVTEKTGNNDGPEIKQMLNICGLGEGNPWCAAYISLALVKVGKDIPDRCAWSPSFFPERRIVWRKGDSHLIPDGAVFGLWFNDKGRIAHVGVILRDTGRGWVITMEGNTNADGSRDGNMAAVRMRKKSQIYVASDWISP